MLIALSSYIPALIHIDPGESAVTNGHAEMGRDNRMSVQGMKVGRV